MKFYLDQNITPRVTPAARRLGLDITDWQEAGMEDTSDPEQLAYATAEGRAIVTRDEPDFLRLAREWLEVGRDYIGIVIVSQEIDADRSGVMARGLARVAALYPEELPINSVLYVGLE